MTPETVFANLYFYYNTLPDNKNNIVFKLFKHLFSSNLAGELSNNNYNKQVIKYLSHDILKTIKNYISY